MDKFKLTDLKKQLFIRSALLSINGLDEILGLNDALSPDEILYEIINKGLREFEQTNPLILEMKLNRDQMGTCYGMEGFYEIKSNFTLYLDCVISEDQIVLVPNAIPQYRVMGSWPVFGNYVFCSEYRRPYLFLGDLPQTQQFYLRGICSRPIIPDYLPDKSFNPDSQKAAVYWMNEREGFRTNLFIDLCLCYLLDYVRQLKASITLPTMSVDVFSNVDAAYQELRSRCDQTILQSGWYGDLLV
jgi:hypothetical protein